MGGAKRHVGPPFGVFGGGHGPDGPPLRPPLPASRDSMLAVAAGLNQSVYNDMTPFEKIYAAYSAL